jgi:hypothetical protein
LIFVFLVGQPLLVPQQPPLLFSFLPLYNIIK